MGPNLNHILAQVSACFPCFSEDSDEYPSLRTTAFVCESDYLEMQHILFRNTVRIMKFSQDWVEKLIGELS